MTNYLAKNVDDFIAGVPENAHPHLLQIRAAVVSALPNAEETISYGKPYYKQPKHLVGFDAYKNHINFEVYTGQLDDTFRTELEEKGYKTGNKSVQIRYDQPVPTKIIKQIAQAQVSPRQ